MKVLVTGFDPFGGESVNPAWEAVKVLAGQTVAGAEVVAYQVPTVFGKSVQTAVDAIAEEKPDAVIAVGQAGGRPDITVERVAINVDDARIKDNEGNQPIDEPIAADGPAAYFATLPIKAMVREIRAAGIPASVSNTAGTFVCNHIMYGILHHIATNQLPIRAGFIHIPFLPEQAVNHPGAPSMAKEVIVEGLKAAIAAVVKYEEDIKEVGGKTH